MRATLGLTSVLLLFTACDARFVDLRAPLATPDGGAAGGADAGAASDGGSSADGGGSVDAGVAADAGEAASTDAGAPLRYQGTWEGRAGHRGVGSASVRRGVDGRFVLELGADFSVSGVPGPVIVLSTRPDLGTTLQPSLGDVEVAELRASSGAQTYDLGERFSAPYVWVFCKPFGVEVARAPLTVVMP